MRILTYSLNILISLKTLRAKKGEIKMRIVLKKILKSNHSSLDHKIVKTINLNHGNEISYRIHNLRIEFDLSTCFCSTLRAFKLKESLLCHI